MVKAPDFGFWKKRKSLEIGSSNLPWVAISSRSVASHLIFCHFLKALCVETASALFVFGLASVQPCRSRFEARTRTLGLAEQGSWHRAYRMLCRVPSIFNTCPCNISVVIGTEISMSMVILSTWGRPLSQIFYQCYVITARYILSEDNLKFESRLPPKQVDVFWPCQFSSIRTLWHATQKSRLFMKFETWSSRYTRYFLFVFLESKTKRAPKNVFEVVQIWMRT